MGDMRQALREGDRTTTGGVQTSTVHNTIADGKRVAGEGDWASCPACKKGGPTMNDAYPSFTLQDGRQILVEGARVLCDCAEKPFVIPSYHKFSIAVNRTGLLQSSSWPSSYRSAMHLGSDVEVIEQYYEITDGAGNPVGGYRYDLFSEGEQVARNSAISGGRTASITGDRGARIVMWLDKMGQERS